MKKTLLFVLPLLLIISCEKYYEKSNTEWFEYSKISIQEELSELIQQIQDVQLYATVSRPSHAAAIAGLTDSDHLTETIAENLVSKVTLEVGFSLLGLEYINSETNFIMVDVNTEAGPVAEGLADLGFQVRTGWDMPQHIRISTGTATR
jgi:histidinol-phosphate aminotransferase